MYSERHAVPQGLLYRLPHRVLITRMPAARDVHGSHRPHQSLLRSVLDRFGDLPHIAIQIDSHNSQSVFVHPS
jgi:hypothetical protein